MNTDTAKQQKLILHLNTPITPEAFASAARACAHVVREGYKECVAEDRDGRQFYVKRTPTGTISVREGVHR